MNDMTEASFRLTKGDREEIVKKAITHAFETRDKAIKSEESALGMDCYREIFDSKVIRAANALPGDWVSSATNLTVSFAAGERMKLTLSKPVRVPESSRYGSSIGFVTAVALNDSFRQLVGRKEDLEREKKELKASLAGLLDRLSTLKQLQSAWPEGAKFYAHLKPRKIAPVPALQIEALNKALGLKTAETAA